MIDVLATPPTVRVPPLAVMEPSATIEVLTVTADVLAMPSTVSVPALAVMEPKKAVVTYKLGDVTTAEERMPPTVIVPVLAVMDPAAIIEALADIVDVLVSPLTRRVPALAVIEPR